MEIAVAYPYEGKSGNFYYWDDVTPEIVKKSDYGHTRDRLRIEPAKGKWFEYDEQNYTETVEAAKGMIMKNMDYFDKEAKAIMNKKRGTRSLSSLLGTARSPIA